MTATPSRHATSLTDGEIVEENDLGSIRRVTADSFPILSGMSIKRIMLNPGAMRTPHWHANANELTYCVSGTSLVSVLDTYSKFSSFTVGAGEMFHIDSGSLHHIENIGEDAAELILAFRSERPEDFGLAAAFGAMTDAVLGNTCDLPASDFAKIRRDTTDRALAARSGDPVVASTAHFDDPHKFAIEAQSPPIGIAVGSARLARLQFWPALKDLSMYSLRIREEGMREPHWHPITAEMGYVRGQGQEGLDGDRQYGRQRFRRALPRRLLTGRCDRRRDRPYRHVPAGDPRFDRQPRAKGLRGLVNWPHPDAHSPDLDSDLQYLGEPGTVHRRRILQRRRRPGAAVGVLVGAAGRRGDRGHRLPPPVRPQ
jgi:oxalate decarboxylase/phosphoglucose isomerase-like protein (cupin superfamily)